MILVPLRIVSYSFLFFTFFFLYIVGFRALTNSGGLASLVHLFVRMFWVAFFVRRGPQVFCGGGGLGYVVGGGGGGGGVRFDTTYLCTLEPRRLPLV